MDHDADQPSSSEAAMLENVTRETFTPHVNGVFRVLPDDGAADRDGVDLVLTEAETTGSQVASSGREPFSLVFRGPGSPSLAQRTYTLEHEIIGRLDIFLVPVGNDGRALLYQAIFN